MPTVEVFRYGALVPVVVVAGLATLAHGLLRLLASWTILWGMLVVCGVAPSHVLAVPCGLAFG